jgi:hypothetical protein
VRPSGRNSLYALWLLLMHTNRCAPEERHEVLAGDDLVGAAEQA